VTNPGLFGYLLIDADAERIARASRYAFGSDGGPPSDAPHGLRAACSVADGDAQLAVDGRPLFQGSPIDNEQDLAEILARYRKVGARLLEELEGPFAIAILQPRHKRALLAVDRMGIERMTYHHGQDGCVFGRQAGEVARFPGLDARLSDQALYDFLFMHMVPAPQTAYGGVLKLPPASALHVEGDRARLERYWLPEYATGGRPSFRELAEELRSSLTTAVRDSGIDAATGAFLSGGLDSSSVAGTLAALSDRPARTFTVGFGEADFDELRYARIANSHFGCEAHEYTMTPADIVDAFPKIAEAYDEPFGNSSAAPTYFCARLAADNGVTHLLAGDGGDELFGGNERYVRHRLFEAYYALPGVVRRRGLERLANSIPPESRVTPLRKLRSYVDQALIPLPERFESWNFMYREGGEGMLHTDFASSIDRDGPMKRMRRVWQSSPTEDLLKTMLWYDWHFTLADNDLRKVGTMSELAGVKVSYPLLHPAVVELSTRVPSRMKIRGMHLRSFFKRAMRDFLPAEIIRKKKHGFGLPFGLWLKTDAQLGDLIYSHLSDLKERRIIDPVFIDQLIEQHRSGHASYFGYAIWDLAMLQAWLARHTR